MSPADKYESGMHSAGLRDSRAIPYDETFRFLTMCSTGKSTAKIQPGLGVKIFYVYFWNEAMLDPEWEGKEVPVRYDPEDLGTAYARIGKQWVCCISAYKSHLSGRSLKQLKIAATEIRRNRSNVEKDRPLAAKELAAFLETSRGEEVLRLQRRKDLAVRQSWAAAAGEAPLPVPAAVAEVPNLKHAPPLSLPEATPTDVYADF
jgi:hypothetical protein